MGGTEQIDGFQNAAQKLSNNIHVDRFATSGTISKTIRFINYDLVSSTSKSITKFCRLKDAVERISATH